MSRLLLILAALSQPVIQTQPVPTVVVRTADGNTHEMPAQTATSRRYIVEFHEPVVTAFSADTTLRRFRSDVRAGAIRHEYVRVFRGASVTLDATDAAAVRRLPYVKALHEDAPVKAFAEDRTRLDRVGARRFWSEWKTRGEGTVVAVIDSGVDYRHPALGGGFGPSFKVIGGWDFVGLDEDPMDEHGHGTHVAGIVAGTGSGVDGVAPDARLLAYRVLNEHGEGSASDVMAAIEWAIDPNRDGDLSDRADVLNLSLGGRGHADDPVARAVDAAVAAGVVVCAAAGNTPGGQTIGSPAAARLAITVGNSDANDAVVFSSSRGPSFPDLALKPEIVAPGTEIVSAKLGGGTFAASGTSMAAPHVAGAAALLLALHPEWSPADVKAALVGRAAAVEEEVMAQGGGRLDVYAAAGPNVTIDPPAVTFGNGTAGAWSSTRTVRVTNRGAHPRTFTATSDASTGASIAVEPAQFELAGGASREVVLRASVAAGAEPPESTLSLGGRVTFHSSDGAASVPWVAIHAARVRTRYEAPVMYQSGIWWSCDDGSIVNGRRTGPETLDALLPYRQCELNVVASSPRGELYLLFEPHAITGDLQLARSTSDSVHAVQLAGVDANGTVIAPEDSPEAPYHVTYVFESGEESRLGPSFSTFSSGPLHVNTLGERMKLTASQVFFDFPNRRVYAINHTPILGVTSDRTLSTLPSDLRHARVEIAPQRGDIDLVAMLAWSVHDVVFGSARGAGPSMSETWRGDVYVTPATNPKAWAAPAFCTGRLRLPAPITTIRGQAVRAVGDSIVMSFDTVPSPAAYAVKPGSTFVIGGTPLAAGSFVDTRETAFAVFPSFFGPTHEYVWPELEPLAYEIRDASGTLLREGNAAGWFSADFGARGAYRATASTKSARLELSFDTSRADWNPPTLSSLRIVGADGLIATRLAPGAPATLVFSVGDYIPTGDDRGRDSRQLRATRAAWRVAGGEWQNLPLTVTADDRGRIEDLGHFESGLHYRAGLGGLTAAGAIDLRIEMEDASGNASVVTLEDALHVGGRRRAARN